MSAKPVELIGGRFDGYVVDAHPTNIRLGFVMVSECPRHGAFAHCGCDDELIYGYFADPGKGAGRFELREDLHG